MEEIINGPDGRGPITTPAEVEEAHKRLRVALLVLEGLKDFTELKGLEGRARDDRIREIRAELYTATPERREELKKNDLYCILDRLIILEGGYPEDKKAKRPTGMSGWHKGKTKYEESKILGKREYWSPLLVFGITQKKLQTLLEAEGTDQEDLDALSYNVLMYRELPFIKLILTNDHLKDAFSWPDDQGLMDGINAERLRNFPDDDPLPLDPGPLIAEFKTEKKSGTLKEDEEE